MQMGLRLLYFALTLLALLTAALFVRSWVIRLRRFLADRRGRLVELCCFYCCEKSTLPGPTARLYPVIGIDRKLVPQFDATGKVLRWYCRRCESWNVYDENGDIASYLPEMRDFKASPSLKTKEATLRRPSPIKEDPVFCDVCSRRQTLLIHALAEYLPEKGHPQYKKRLSEYPEYKKYLETRYPMACEACSGRAEIELLKQERRYKLAALNFPKQKHASPPRPPSKSKLLKRTWSVTVSLFKYAKTAKLFVVMSAVALVGWFSLLSWARMFFHTQYEELGLEHFIVNSDPFNLYDIREPTIPTLPTYLFPPPILKCALSWSGFDHRCIETFGDYRAQLVAQTAIFYMVFGEFDSFLKRSRKTILLNPPCRFSGKGILYGVLVLVADYALTYLVRHLSMALTMWLSTMYMWLALFTIWDSLDVVYLYFDPKERLQRAELRPASYFHAGGGVPYRGPTFPTTAAEQPASSSAYFQRSDSGVELCPQDNVAPYFNNLGVRVNESDIDEDDSDFDERGGLSKRMFTNNEEEVLARLSGLGFGKHGRNTAPGLHQTSSSGHSGRPLRVFGISDGYRNDGAPMGNFSLSSGRPYDNMWRSNSHQHGQSSGWRSNTCNPFLHNTQNAMNTPVAFLNHRAWPVKPDASKLTNSQSHNASNFPVSQPQYKTRSRENFTSRPPTSTMGNNSFGSLSLNDDASEPKAETSWARNWKQVLVKANVRTSRTGDRGMAIFGMTSQIGDRALENIPPETMGDANLMNFAQRESEVDRIASLIKPQTFFPRAQTTGLEDLFASTVHVKEENVVAHSIRTWFSATLNGHMQVALRYLQVAAPIGMIASWMNWANIFYLPMILLSLYHFTKHEILLKRQSKMSPQSNDGFGNFSFGAESPTTSDVDPRCRKMGRILAIAALVRFLLAIFWQDALSLDRLFNSSRAMEMELDDTMHVWGEPIPVVSDPPSAFLMTIDVMIASIVLTWEPEMPRPYEAI